MHSHLSDVFYGAEVIQYHVHGVHNLN